MFNKKGLVNFIYIILLFKSALRSLFNKLFVEYSRKMQAHTLQISFLIKNRAMYINYREEKNQTYF